MAETPLAEQRRWAAGIVRVLSLYGFLADAYVLVGPGPAGGGKAPGGGAMRAQGLSKLIPPLLLPPPPTQEFFTDELWRSLPRTWQAALAPLPPPALAQLLLGRRSSGSAPAGVR